VAKKAINLTLFAASFTFAPYALEKAVYCGFTIFFCSWIIPSDHLVKPISIEYQTNPSFF